MLQNPSSNIPPFISLELDFKGGRKRNWRNKRGKKYAKTVHDEEERKMEFSNYSGESDEFREGEGESDFEGAEDRIRPYDPSKDSGKGVLKKEYIIDNFNPEVDNSSKISSKPNKHKRKSSGLIDQDFMGNYQKDLKEGEKHIMVSDKYSFDIDQEDYKPQDNKYKEEHKEKSYLENQDEDRIKLSSNIKIDNSSGQNKQKDGFKVNIPSKDGGFGIDGEEIMKYQNMKEKIKSMNDNRTNPAQNIGEYSSLQNKIMNGEPNNNDLDSVRSSNY